MHVGGEIGERIHDCAASGGSYEVSFGVYGGKGDEGEVDTFNQIN